MVFSLLARADSPQQKYMSLGPRQNLKRNSDSTVYIEFFRYNTSPVRCEQQVNDNPKWT